MSDQQQPAEPATNAQPQAPGINAESRPEPPQQQLPLDSPTGADANPQWLPARLEQARQAERNKLLQEMGVEKPSDIKARLEQLQKLEDEKLSDQERTEKLIKELQPKAEQAERLQNMFASVVEAKFGALPEQQQAAIDAVANGSAEERWKFMQVLEAAGGLTPVQTPQPKPANTAPQGQPPPNPATPKTPYDKWQDLKTTNPVAASVFYQSNAFAIENSKGSQ